MGGGQVVCTLEWMGLPKYVCVFVSAMVEGERN